MTGSQAAQHLASLPGASPWPWVLSRLFLQVRHNLHGAVITWVTTPPSSEP